VNRSDRMEEDTAPGGAFLAATDMIDADHPAVVAFAQEAVEGAGRDPADLAVRLFYAVRDRIRYDPYVPFYRSEHYRASVTLALGRGFCVTKAVLLCTLGRALMIPSRLGFADLRNHLATPPLIETLGTNLFVYHGFTEFWLHGRWIKATPAFNAELFERQQVAPVDFDGRRDAVLPPHTRDGRPFIEYLGTHGFRVDVPLTEIVAAWRQAYGNQRVDQWIAGFEEGRGMRGSKNSSAYPD
jgi:transglutaminase-like putative cysteine protease